MEKSISQIQIGERLRHLRKGQGLSVRTLASRAGFSPSFVSQVEHGQVSPSIASLERLAAVLGVTLGGFFTELTSNPVTVVRAPDRQELTSAWSHATLEALGPVGGSHMLEPFLLTLAAGGRSGTRLHAALGEQFALVYAGTVTLTLPDECYALSAGDAVSLAPVLPHQWHNTGSDPACVLLVAVRLAAFPRPEDL